MNKLQYPPGSSCQFDELIPQSISSQILIQTQVFAYVQPPLVQKICELNKVLIFEEILPDSSIHDSWSFWIVSSALRVPDFDTENSWK